MGEQGDRPAPARPSFARRAAAPLLAAVCGALPVLIFPAPGWWWFAYVCLVPLMLVLRAAPTPRRALLLGWWGGMGFLIGVMSWLIPSLSVAIVALAAFLGVLWAPWGWLVHRLLHGTPDVGRALAALVLVPTGWLLTETVRSWQYLGGPWGLLGASQYQQHFALRLASVGGVWLDSLLIVAVNTAVVVLVAAWGRSAVAWLTLVGLALGTFAVTAWAPQPRLTGRTAVVGVVQPGLADDTIEDRTVRGEQLTATLGPSRPDLVLWGESSVSYDLAARPDLTTRLAASSAAVGADLLVNVDAVRPGSGGIYKSSVLVGPQGPTGARYDKIRLVPFGEYIPLRPVLGWVKNFSKAAAVDRRRGTGPVVMTVPTRDGGSLAVGPLICFESAFPDMSRALVQRGAQVILVQSATPTFQQTWAPEQHASLAALRAAETGRPVVQATLTGVSVAYDPSGNRVGQQLGKDDAGAVAYTVPLATGSTLYDRWGNWVPTGSALTVLLCGGVWLLLARRDRRRDRR
ncbi:apolipoprotein N-acyltransferase [Streptacidiphilus rugosus]|uniref:apolipoprotein N-acyltransferase n=1 Tax=Streptacidiphilus rugosus TaxID=405783 RepID=UPI0007C804E5|nr:apolipoprotein N-acyltransferase [Streptacidiphilus rugosus]